MRRTLLFIGGGEEAIPAFEKAREMGLRIICFDGNDSCPGFKVSDAYEVIDTYDYQGCADIADLKYPEISGVLSVGADVPVSVAAVGERLGLNTVSMDVAMCVSDKVIMKDMFSTANLPIPEYRAVSEPSEIKEFLTKHGGRVVVKPTDSRGARGVVVVDHASDATWAFQQARDISATNSVMVERFVSGPQFSTEGFVNNGKYFHVGTSDRNYQRLGQFKPYIIEDGGSLPATLTREQIEAIEELLQSVASCLEMRTGVLKGDLVLDIDHGFFRVIEVATRLSGGYFCTHEIPLSVGFDFVQEAINQALGEPSSLSGIADAKKNVCQRFVFGTPGIVKSLPNMSLVENMPGIKLAKCRVNLGDSIGCITSHISRMGLVIATGDTAMEAEKNCMAAVAFMEHNIEVCPHD